MNKVSSVCQSFDLFLVRNQENLFFGSGHFESPNMAALLRIGFGSQQILALQT